MLPQPTFDRFKGVRRSPSILPSSHPPMLFSSLGRPHTLTISPIYLPLPSYHSSHELAVLQAQADPTPVSFLPLPPLLLFPPVYLPPHFQSSQLLPDRSSLKQEYEDSIEV